MNLFQKIGAWIAKEFGVAETWLSKEEGQLVLLLKPMFSQAEAAAIMDVKQFLSGVLLAGGTSVNGQDLATLEGLVMNKLEVLGGDLLATAKSLGSNALQVLIGMALAELKAVPQAAT